MGKEEKKGKRENGKKGKKGMGGNARLQQGHQQQDDFGELGVLCAGDVGDGLRDGVGHDAPTQGRGDVVAQLRLEILDVVFAGDERTVRVLVAHSRSTKNTVGRKKKPYAVTAA